MFAVAVTNAPIFARILRGSLLVAAGLGLRRWPPARSARRRRGSCSGTCCRTRSPPLIVAATLALATAIIDVAGLGFLGLGPADPRIAEWGTMLTDASSFYRQAPWIIFFTGAAISITRDRVQPPRRRPARVARPAAASDDAPTRRPRRRGGRARPTVRRSSRSRTWSSGSGPTRGRSTPSTASPSTSSEGETPRPRRRVRAAARASRTSRSCACCPSRPAGSRAGGSCSTARTSSTLREDEIRDDPRAATSR